MALFTSHSISNIKGFAIGLLVALGCVAFQKGSVLISDFASEDIRFQREGTETTWTADITSLPDGNYYVSVGRPRGPCDLLLDTKQIDSNRSELPELRTKLLLAAPFHIGSNSHPRQVRIVCEHQSGFAGDLTHEPIVAGFKTGVAIQMWRGITETLIGPVAAFMILISAFYRRRGSKLGANDKPIVQSNAFEGWRYVFFGAASFAYALSLAYYTRLFLDGMPATVVHIVLRNIFAIAGTSLFMTPGRSRPSLLAFQIIATASAAVCGYVYPEYIVDFYHWEYFSCPIVTAILYHDAVRTSPKTKAQSYVRPILFAWALIQFVDATLLWTGFGAYSAPTVILLLCLSVLYLRGLERDRTERIEVAVSEILKVAQSKEPIISIVKKIGELLREQTNFERASAYVDGFCVGVSDAPGKSFVRVMEMGYAKNTDRDATINFGEGRGTRMAAALKGRSPILANGYGSSVAFINIPIGSHSCVNLSDANDKNNFLAFESQEAIRRMFAALEPLDRRLVEAGYQQGAALNKIRMKRGDGIWEEDIVSIFVDLNDFSKLSDKYGDRYTRFCSEIFIPAFIKKVSAFTVSEHLAGDEVYLIITKDLLPTEMGFIQATVRTLVLIDDFVENSGADLAGKHGYPKITVSVGANIGAATIISDTVSVRTSGSGVNHAKRLQEEAGRNSILVKSGLGLDLTGTHLMAGEEFVILKKKQVIGAQRIIRTRSIRTRTSEYSTGS